MDENIFMEHANPISDVSTVLPGGVLWLMLSNNFNLLFYNLKWRNEPILTRSTCLHSDLSSMIWT